MQTIVRRNFLVLTDNPLVVPQAILDRLLAPDWRDQRGAVTNGATILEVSADTIVSQPQIIQARYGLWDVSLTTVCDQAHSECCNHQLPKKVKPAVVAVRTKS